MQTALTFLFGKIIAHHMQLLEDKLQAVQGRHEAYFATTRSKVSLDGVERPATLAEFVQPRWLAGVPTLEIDPALPQQIAAECLVCLRQVVASLAVRPAAPRKLMAKWADLFLPLLPKPRVLARSTT